MKKVPLKPRERSSWPTRSVASLPGPVLVSALPVATSAEISSSFGTIAATFCKKTFSKVRAISTMSSVG